MKKFLLLALLTVSIHVLNAQTVSSLSQNFDGICTSATAFPASWLHYNPLSTPGPQGQWMCDPSHGRTNGSGSPTPGVSCTGVWAGAYHVDTSYLVTPKFDFSGHSHAYLYFDDKTDSIMLGGKLHLLVYNADSPGVGFIDTNAHSDATGAMNPLITSSDSAGWVTHYLDLTTFLGHNFYVAFMYTSATTSGSQWFIDNVNTSFYRLDVPTVEPEILPVSVRGISTPSDIRLSFGNVIQGAWQLSIFDMMGRQVYSRNINPAAYTDTYTITDAGLAPGLYVVRMTNGSSYGSTKLSIQ